jgi:ABC transport system ATP-binding/permease protein
MLIFPQFFKSSITQLLNFSMNFLTLENITKSYGEKMLFRNLTLHIDKGQKIGLIAKNGSGKTTLLRVIAGLEGSEGESAKIIFRKDIRIGWLEQEPDFDPSLDILSAALDIGNPLVKVVRRYENALLNMEDVDEINAAIAEMDLHDAWTFEERVKEMLTRFKLDKYDQKVSSLSGGQQKRLALASVLLRDPDFLILDEPTNHLDVDMIEWLEQYLQAPGITLFMVTHDRYFLENICDNMIELDNGTIHRYKGNYSEYLEKKSMREEVESSTYERNKKMLKDELEWVRASPSARTGKAKARLDNYYNRKEDNDSKKVIKDEMSIQIKESYLGGKILECHNVGKSYGGKVLFDKFDYKFRRKERVGIVGVNGAGKSTFLKVITEGLAPDTGKVVVGDTVVFGYYKQDGLQLTEDKRVIDVIRDIADVIPLTKGKEMTAAQLLEKFLFSRSQQSVYASQLSGGEKRRLYLLTVIMKNPNFLILDEPTNDLDVMTLQVLEDFLEDFPGCLVVVTHDRYFMDRLVEHLFVFEGDGKIKDYMGSYAEYRAEKKEEEAALKSGAQSKSNVTSTATTVVKQTLSGTERNEMKKLEKEIAQGEARKKEIMKKFDDPTLAADQMSKLSLELGTLQDTLEEKEMRWLELSEKS